MPLCCVLQATLSVSFGAIVQIVIFLLQSSNIFKVQASLPPGAEDEIVLIEHMPGRRVHLQDFFWSDLKDAPPWVDPSQGLTFYETRTVHHTVTLYSTVKEDDKKSDGKDSNDPATCITCIEPTPRLDEDEDQNIGILIGEDPGPRYWLLTVLRSGETVPAKIELKLARLYRTAFSRQQQQHLGLLHLDNQLKRFTRDHLPLKLKPDVTIDGKTFKASMSSIDKFKTDKELVSEENHTMIKETEYENLLLLNSNISWNDQPKEQDSKDRIQLNQSSLIEEEVSFDKNASIKNQVELWGNLIQANQSLLLNNLLSNKSYDFHNLTDYNSTIGEQMVNNSVNMKSIDNKKLSELRSMDHARGETVQVRMQNTSVTDDGATKLIYSVHLGGKPVPAETAARDMALLSPQEVALELGAPVLIQSEPYLKETRPLALSRKRDAWLLIGAASAGFILLALVVTAIIFLAKRKKSHSAVSVPPSHNILKKKRGYIQTNVSLDNALSTSEMEIKTEGTSQRQTPRSLSRTPVSVETADSLEEGIHDISSDEDELKRKTQDSSSWEHSLNKSKLVQARMSRTNAIDMPRTSDSTDVIVDHLDTLDSLDNDYSKQEDVTASPHSYLSMPSCKQFPSMKTVEPLSRVLEPVMVMHLDIESPELAKKNHDHRSRENEAMDRSFVRSSSAMKEPGVLSPVVWKLWKQNFSEGTDYDPTYDVPPGPVGRTRRRLHELLEDSFTLFGSRDSKREVHPPVTRPNTATLQQDVLTIFSETKGRSVLTSPVLSPPVIRPRTSLPAKQEENRITEGRYHPQQTTQCNWGSRPLSAGPFHRPNLPHVNVGRVMADCQLRPEDPAVPLIASIRKELEKFSPEKYGQS